MGKTNKAQQHTAPWIQEEYARTDQIKRMEWEHITKDEITSAMSLTANWKSPGIDGITNFWLKKLHSVH